MSIAKIIISGRGIIPDPLRCKIDIIMPLTLEQKREKSREKMRKRRAAMTPEDKALEAEANRKYQKSPARRAYDRKRNATENRRVRRKAYDLTRTYGITPEQWSRMFAEQDSCCAICKSPSPEQLRGWHTDHCHDTGKVRGILCHSCNMLLGHAKDKEIRLLAAVTYLQKAATN